VADIDDLFTPPNAGAYERREIRDGTPLDYVGEKLGTAVKFAYRTYAHIEKYVPDDLAIPQRAEGTGFSVKVDGLLSPAFTTFRAATTAFLALHNMLGLIQEQAKFDALLQLDSGEFDAWVERIEREGSVTG
jgi:hypothetical protein